MDPKYRHIGPPAIRLLEELSEASKAVCKGLRFGWNSHVPKLGYNSNNFMELMEEMDDVLSAYDDLKEELMKCQEPSET